MKTFTELLGLSAEEHFPPQLKFTSQLDLLVSYGKEGRPRFLPFLTAIASC